ncbi:Stm1/Oga1 family protein Smp4 [Schizosaccharomyces osmophilus]|uniref:Stm1/Oga1 family protein Smp4 n=1 Tax=Schizosaccharomyces osmophilus TaxID=2545709 RepID=A0AAF0AW59_9SCHI|nr:Stm1/Oga1 family protein Smp4 [Schizosaccharomyces osmophilus]WBW73217.1 Stm1/Oga1 family protein Smp4 [Schizosaccharomyces osmophilus]
MSPAPYKDLNKDTVHTHPPVRESERREEHGWGTLKQEPLMEDQAEHDAEADMSKDLKEVKQEASRPPPSK